MTLHTPVVFLPGTLCDERIFLPVWRRLDLTERAYVPLQWANTLDEMLALTEDRVCRYEQKVHLVGFSMGGFVASRFATQNPANIASLTLIGYDPTGLTKDEINQRTATVKHIKAKKYGGMSKLALRRFIHEQHLDSEQVAGVVKDMEKDLGAGVLKAQIEATTPRPTLISALSDMPFAIDFIVGQEDQIAPFSGVQTSQQGLSNSRLEVIEDAGHMMLLEQPARCADVLYTMLNTTA